MEHAGSDIKAFEASKNRRKATSMKDEDKVPFEINCRALSSSIINDSSLGFLIKFTAKHASHFS